MTEHLPPAVGDEAPDFTLPSYTGEEVTLSDLRGKSVVLVFYPFAFTGRCTGELCELRDNIAMFEDGNVTLLAISVDTKASLGVFAEQQGYQFPLLSDFWPHGAVARLYGAFLEETGFATRATFVINAEGRIHAAFRTSPGESRPLEAYREAIAAL